MNVEDVTGADIASVIAATIDAAVDAYPVLVVPELPDDPAEPLESDDAHPLRSSNEFNARVTAVNHDPRHRVNGLATVDLELTDRDGIARTFTITITTQEKP